MRNTGPFSSLKAPADDGAHFLAKKKAEAEVVARSSELLVAYPRFLVLYFVKDHVQDLIGEDISARRGLR
jgi:hypothetical protein